MGADEPQISMAQDTAKLISSGKNPNELANGVIDMSNNMAPFIIIYDNFGKVIAGNGYLDSSIPQVPIGVLSAADNQKQNVVTWQPKKGVRIASVSVKVENYYVLSGRSLEKVENRINSFGKWLVLAWLVVIASLFALHRATKKKPKKENSAT